jgi:hypothetical protein
MDHHILRLAPIASTPPSLRHIVGVLRGLLEGPNGENPVAVLSINYAGWGGRHR